MSLSAERVTTCLPIDVARLFDSQVTQTQIDADTFLNSSSGDSDALAAMIEDAEDEFRQRTNADMRVGRVGVGDKRETFETVTYKVSGHKQYRRSFSDMPADYSFREGTVSLDNSRVLPFDTAQGDAVYLYVGFDGADSWEEISDEDGDSWTIINHTSGRIAIDPNQLERIFRSSGGLSFGSQRQRDIRLTVSYRYGALGGDRGSASSTELDASLSNSQTGTVSVKDGGGFPVGADGGTITVLIGTEYLQVRPQPDTDEMDIVARGVRGTTEASHSSGDRIQYTPPSIRKAIASRAGATLITASTYRGYLPDTDADVDQNDVLAELTETWDTTVAALS